ncbi:MAG: hypothetical protein HGA23_11215, partial [Bacteroidales bacterium]|nr:hypothetical protein [Bacteroidales bacterium]
MVQASDDPDPAGDLVDEALGVVCGVGEEPRPSLQEDCHDAVSGPRL